MRLFLAAALISLAVRVSPAPAATFTVNTAADLHDLTPGNDRCVAYLIVFPPYVFPFCTLRAAIEETNALPGPDRIILPAGIYPLDIPGMNEDAGGSGDLDITDHLILSGAGPDETIIDAGGLDRVLDLFGPDTEVAISGLTIRNGRLPPGLATDEAGGGGIRNAAILSLTGVRLQGNRVNGTSPADAGGGLFNTATCVLRNSTIDQNRAASGGGVANQNGSSLEIQASTLSDNQSETGAGLFNKGRAKVANSTLSGNRAQESDLSAGGGILNRGTLELVQSTLANNQASEGGGGISNEGELSLVNTLLAANISGDCDLPWALTSLGHNLDSDATCGLSAATDLSGLDPKIDSLASHGGPTKTHGLLLGSPAVDRGRDLAAGGVTTDQRGYVRPQGSAFDIGAFETSRRSLAPLLAPLLLRKNRQ